MHADGRLRLVAYALRVLVGTVFAFLFFDNLDHDNYSAAGVPSTDRELRDAPVTPRARGRT